MNNNIPGIPEEMEVLQFLFSSENDKIGILVMAQDFFEGSSKKVHQIHC